MRPWYFTVRMDAGVLSIRVNEPPMTPVFLLIERVTLAGFEPLAKVGRVTVLLLL